MKGIRNGYGFMVGLLLGMAVAGVPSLAQTRAGNGGAEPLRINIWVYNYAQASEQTLKAGDKIAAHIFHQAGVEVASWNCHPAPANVNPDPNCAPQSGPLNLWVRIVPDLAVVPGVTDHESLGLAFGDYASVSFRWVKEEAAMAGVAPSEILGRAIAHELGHLLLRQPGHSRVGIMRARWSTKDFDRSPLGSLSFTPEQAESIRAEVQARAQEQAALGIASADGSH